MGQIDRHGHERLVARRAFRRERLIGLDVQREGEVAELDLQATEVGLGVLCFEDRRVGGEIARRQVDRVACEPQGFLARLRRALPTMSAAVATTASRAMLIGALSGSWRYRVPTALT